MTDTNVMEGFSSEWKAIIDKIQAQTDSLSRLRGELGALRSTPEHTAARDAAKQAETLQVETHTGVATRTPEEVTRELGSASMKDMSEISKVLENMQKFPGLDANTQAILGQLYATAGENGIGTLLDEIVHFRKKTLPKLSPLVQTTFDDVLKKMTAALDDM